MHNFPRCLDLYDGGEQEVEWIRFMFRMILIKKFSLDDLYLIYIW